MCGIAGEFRWDSAVDPVTTKKMTDALLHRGPDGHAIYARENIALGHTRLAIIDTSSRANQPMWSHCGRYVIVYNGEIYNFSDIRKRLESRGKTFTTGSDTEVVVEAWAEWGSESTLEFNGMFAFALFDTKKGELFLVRDRYGIKPLYYFVHSAGVAFASEQKALRCHPQFPRSFDKAALIEYLTFQNIFTDRTLVDGVKLLPAASIASATSPKRQLTVTTYWDFHFHSDKEESNPAEKLEEVRRLVRQAVKRQLVSDVEVGSFLSGGLDSGLIVAIASQHNNSLKTFTCGFDLSSASGLELAFDERQRAEAMSALFETEHYEMVLKAGDMERSLSEVVRSIEEPRVGQSYPNYFASLLASKFVKVALAGTGGDELFAGYPWRYHRNEYVRTWSEFADSYFSSWQRLMSPEELQTICRPIATDVHFDEPKEIFRSLLAKHQQGELSERNQVQQSLYLEAKTFLSGLLNIEDKLAMHHGLEIRVPMLDNDLVNFAMRCPPELKLDLDVGRILRDENVPGNKSDSFPTKRQDGKIILREAASSILPDLATRAPKQGFSAPDASWFRGRSIDFVKRRLFEGESPLFDLLEKKATLALVSEHLDGRRNRRLLVWSLLYLDEYLRMN